VRLEGVVRELYDVAFIPDIRNPSAIDFKTDRDSPGHHHR
jgi:hypothetical protein